MSVYSDFGWSLPRGKPPSERHEGTAAADSTTATTAADTSRQSPATRTTQADDNYFVIESRFNIVVIRIVVVSLQIVAIVAILTFILSAVYELIVRLRFVAQNVAAELVPFGFYFLSIVAVMLVVYWVGRFLLQEFLE